MSVVFHYVQSPVLSFVCAESTEKLQKKKRKFSHSTISRLKSVKLTGEAGNELCIWIERMLIDYEQNQS